MKKIRLLILMLVVSLFLAACGSSSVNGSKVTGDKGGTNLKFAHPYDEKHPLHLASQRFADQVEKETNGSIKFMFYPNGSLGGANDLFEGLQMGTVDISLIATPIVGRNYKPIDLFYLPFLFNDNEHAYKVADGDVGETLYKEIRESLGVNTLAMFESGFRTITNSKHTVRTPEDLNGLKLRVADAGISIDTFKALNVNGSPIALNELFTALQQGTVDGQDNPLGNVYTQKFYEVQPYVTLSGHQWAGIMVLINDEVFNGFTEEEQKIIRNAAKEAQEWERNEMQKAEKEYVDSMKDAGVEITELTVEEKEKFREKMQEVWTKYEGDIGIELINKAKEAGVK